MYVGQTNNLRTRWRAHFNKLRIGAHGNSHLQNAYAKYGAINFEFEILEYCVLSSLDAREVHWMRKFRSCDRQFGYNVDQFPSGTGPRSLATLRKLKVALKYARASKAPTLSVETRKRISAANKGLLVGIPKTSAHKKALSKAQLRRFSKKSERLARAEQQRRLWEDPSYRAKLVAAHTGRHLPPWTAARRAKFMHTLENKPCNSRV